MSHLKSVHLKHVHLKSVLSKICPPKKRRGPGFWVPYLNNFKHGCLFKEALSKFSHA